MCVYIYAETLQKRKVWYEGGGKSRTVQTTWSRLNNISCAVVGRVETVTKLKLIQALRIIVRPLEQQWSSEAHLACITREGRNRKALSSASTSKGSNSQQEDVTFELYPQDTQTSSINSARKSDPRVCVQWETCCQTTSLWFDSEQQAELRQGLSSIFTEILVS